MPLEPPPDAPGGGSGHFQTLRCRPCPAGCPSGGGTRLPRDGSRARKGYSSTAAAPLHFPSSSAPCARGRLTKISQTCRAHSAQHPPSARSPACLHGSRTVWTVLMTGLLSSEDPDESALQPATRDRDAIAASRRRQRLRLNTRTLLDLPYQGWAADPTAAPARPDPLGRGARIGASMTTLSSVCVSCDRRHGRHFRRSGTRALRGESRGPAPRPPARCPAPVMDAGPDSTHPTPAFRKMPPSTTSVWPVIQSDWSEVRNAAAPPMSEGTPSRPSG